LPPAIAGRTDKIGYEPPQKTWLADPRMTDRVNSGARSLAAAGILNPKTLDLIQSREENTTIFTSYNWKILMAANLLEF
jgi:asparagine synthase (glutamine-hydrolysing)